MDTCTSIFFHSQTDEILADIESVQLCIEVEEADMFAHCFYEEFVDGQQEAVENESNKTALQAGGSLSATSSNITEGYCSGVASTSASTEGSHIAVASYPDNIPIEPYAVTNSDNMFCSACQKEIFRNKK